MKKEMYTRDLLKRTNQMASLNLKNKMDKYTKGDGSKTRKMVMAIINGLMVLFIQDSIIMEKSMALVRLYTQMENLTKVNGFKEKNMEMDNLNLINRIFQEYGKKVNQSELENDFIIFIFKQLKSISE